MVKYNVLKYLYFLVRKMKIHFLGTAAAEGIPALFCTCENCKYARKHKGKNIRTRFSILIDDVYKIDFPPDSYLHLLRYNLDYTKLKSIFVTHDHCDHIQENEFEMMMKYFTNERNLKVNIYGTEVIVDKINSVIGPNEIINKPNVSYIKPFDIIEDDYYKVTVLPADHISRGKPLMYYFYNKKENVSFLCAHDTGYFKEEVWEFLKDKKLDVISLDGTALCFNQKVNHLGFDGIYMVKERLEKEKIIDKNTKFIINHFSHNPQMNHKQIVKEVKNKGIIVAYDGMKLKV